VYFLVLVYEGILGSQPGIVYLTSVASHPSSATKRPAKKRGAIVNLGMGKNIGE